MLLNKKIMMNLHNTMKLIKEKIVLLLLLILSCGVFQPRDTFELPVVTVVVDRFNFGSIFDSIGRPIVWKDYETFFADSFSFSDARTGIFGKTKFIENLRQLERKNERFKIIWSNIEKPTEGEMSRLTINELKYTFIEDTSAVEKKTETGKSRMVIVRDNSYKLIAWDDFPDMAAKSIFTPE